MKLWTSELVGEAVKLLSEGHDTQEVADTLNNKYNTDFSKEAIRIKVNRQGYSTGGKPLEGREQEPLPAYIDDQDDLTNLQNKIDKALDDAKKDKVVVKSVGTTTSGETEADVEGLFNTKREFTQDELLKMAGLEPKDFKLKQVKGSKWSVVTTKYGRKWNFYTSVIAIPRVASLDEMIAEINQNVDSHHYASTRRGNDNLVIPLPDMHFGWTSYADVKNKIVQLQEIMQHGYDTIVIEQLGDLFHSDQIHSTQTVRGTILDDVNMRQAFRDASKLFADIIPVALQNAREVRYYTVFGNHSGDLEYAYGLALKAKYPQVQFNMNDDSPATDWRCAYSLGHVGIMMAHGDVSKNRLTGLFPLEYKSIWSKSSTTEIFTGHYHTEKFKEENGIMWRQLGTPKPSDPYEIKNGFTGSKKLMYAFVYDDARMRVMYEL